MKDPQHHCSDLKVKLGYILYLQALYLTTKDLFAAWKLLQEYRKVNYLQFNDMHEEREQNGEL